MRYGRLIAVFIFMVAAFFSGGTGLAENPSVNQNVYVQAVVPPSSYVIINRSGQILEIGANSAEATEPQVYLDKVARANQVGLSTAVREQYKQLLAGQKLHAGILYKRPAAPTKKTQLEILNTSSI